MMMDQAARDGLGKMANEGEMDEDMLQCYRLEAGQSSETYIVSVLRIKYLRPALLIVMA